MESNATVVEIHQKLVKKDGRAVNQSHIEIEFDDGDRKILPQNRCHGNISIGTRGECYYRELDYGWAYTFTAEKCQCCVN